jgi:hypothetical protein
MLFLKCALVLAALACAACGGRGTDGLTATVAQETHPVLIRNDRNALLQVVVNSKRTDPVRVQALEFSLTGTGDPADLESLEVYYDAPKQDLAAVARFGEAAPPSSRISFRRGRDKHVPPAIILPAVYSVLRARSGLRPSPQPFAADRVELPHHRRT